jgi:hypothetical protein
VRWLAAFLALAGVALIVETAWYVPRLNTDPAIIAVICGLGAIGFACIVIYGD